MRAAAVGFIALSGCALALSGCGLAWKNQRITELEQQVEQINGRLDDSERSQQALLQSLDGMRSEIRSEIHRIQVAHERELKRILEEQERAVRQVALRKAQETDELSEAQRRLAETLKKELGDAQAKLAMTERGLVLTLLDEIFFDSGQSVIKPEGFEVLEKVGKVLREAVPESPLAVEGHTDNVPIRYSSWRSNWELSSARALAVVHQFIDKEGLPPDRIRAVGFGEYHPVSPNETPEGRRQNRRVEVVVLPKAIKKAKVGDLAGNP